MTMERYQEYDTPTKATGWAALPYRSWMADTIKLIIIELPEGAAFTPTHVWNTFSTLQQNITTHAYPTKTGPFIVNRTMMNMNALDGLHGLARTNTGQGQSRDWVYYAPTEDKDELKHLLYTTETPLEEAPPVKVTVKETIPGPDITIGTPDDTPEWVRSDETWEMAARRFQKYYEKKLALVTEMVEYQDTLIAEAVAKAKEEWVAYESPRENEELGSTRTFTVAGFLTDGTPLWRNDQGFLGDVSFEAL